MYGMVSYSPFRLIRDVELPDEFVHKALASPIGRQALSCNGRLPGGAWGHVLDQHGPGTSPAYLLAELGPERALHLAGRAGDLLGPAGLLSDLPVHHDVEVGLGAELLGAPGAGPALVRAAGESRSPWLAAAALRSAGVDQADKLAVVDYAFRAERLAWLGRPENDNLPDGTIWAHARVDEVDLGDLAMTLMASRLQLASVQIASQLLYLRPGLVGWAVTTTDPLWLTAAAAVPLGGGDQARLVRSEQAIAKADYVAFLGTLRTASNQMWAYSPGPVGRLAAMPWAAPATLSYVRDNGAILVGLYGSKLIALGAEYNCYLLRDLDELPACNLATGAVGDVDKWCKHAGLCRLDYTYVVLEAMANQGYSRRSTRAVRQRAAKLLPEQAGLVLARSKSNVGGPGMPEPTSLLRATRSSTNTANNVSCTMAGLLATLGEVLDTRELEIALTLIADGTDLAGRELIELSKALCATW